MRKMRAHILTSMLILGAGIAFAQTEATGFWKTIDDETGKPKSVIALYVYKDILFGRILMTYREDGVTVKDDLYRQQTRSPYLKGNPPFCGLDIIWDMRWDEKRKQWRGGTIMDPGNDTNKKPKTYGCEIWREGSDLVVRGKIAFLGRNQTWKPFDPKDFPPGFAVPDPSTFVPVIPEKD
mgnify:FL=1